jgi:hypothetical protein
MQPDALVVAVDRHQVARPGQVEHQLDLLAVAVPGGVDRSVAGGDDALTLLPGSSSFTGVFSLCSASFDLAIATVRRRP